MQRALFLLLFLAISLGQLVISIHKPASIYVPKDFDSIQAALDAAPAGARIWIDSRQGPYIENLVISTANLHLRSANGRAIIRGDSQQNSVVHILANGVLFAGFRIEQGNTGLLLDRVSDVRIEGNEIRNGIQGIGLIEATGNSLKRNHIGPNDSIGILLQGSSQNHFAHNTMIDNAVGGIFLEQGSVENQFEQNHIERSDMAVRLMTSNANFFLANRIVDSRTFGFSIESSSDLVIERNTLKENGTGIQALNGLGLRFHNNLVQRNEIGLELVGSVRRISMQENSFINNLDYALLSNSPEQVDAIGNFWGEQTGPVIEGKFKNSTRSNLVSGNVLVEPWLNRPVHF